MTEPNQFAAIAVSDLSAVQVQYTYTPEEEAARRDLIELIETEKREYLRRIEPLVKRLANIHGAPRYIVQR